MEWDNHASECGYKSCHDHQERSHHGACKGGKCGEGLVGILGYLSRVCWIVSTLDLTCIIGQIPARYSQQSLDLSMTLELAVDRRVVVRGLMMGRTMLQVE